MDEVFLTRVILSFIVAGTWITLVTILAEKLGTKIGGLVGNLPSNIVVSFFFIAWTQTPLFAATAARMIPLALAIDIIFLFVFVVAVKRYGNNAFLLALISWAILAIPLGLIGYDDIVVGSVICILVAALLFYILEYNLKIKSIEKKVKTKHSVSEILTRAVFAGGVVAGAVIIAAVLGPIWGGIFAIFPASMLSNMYLLKRAQGIDFARATGKVMLPASTNNLIYGLIVYLTYPIYGLIFGTIFSYIGAAIFVAIFYPFMKKIR